MKIEVTIDLNNSYAENGTLSELIEDVIKAEITKQLRKSDAFKECVKQLSEKAIKNISKK